MKIGVKKNSFWILRILTLLIILNLVISNSISIKIFSNTESEAQAILDQKTSAISDQLDNIDQELARIAAGYEDSKTATKTLSREVSGKQLDIQKTDQLITDTRLVIGQIEKQIQANQIEIDDLNKEIKDLLLDLQERQSTSPIKIIFSSSNLGQALSKIYSINSTKENIERIRETVSQKTANLETTKKQNLEIQLRLEKTRSLLKGQQSNLEYLLAQTKGQENEYQKLLDSISNQKKILDTQLDSLQGEYLAELADLRNDEELANQTGSGCKFEAAGSLGVGKDYFVRPAKGYLTQGFHCGHDGIDIADGLGSELVSIADGVVERVGPRMDGCIGLKCNGGYGNYILIKHNLPGGKRIYSLYAHLHRQPNKVIGQNVTRGETIGLMGCSGYTKPYPCGVHIHFMMLSDSFEQTGLGCRLGSSKCYNPANYINI